jgi:hypothetical protein
MTMNLVEIEYAPHEHAFFRHQHDLFAEALTERDVQVIERPAQRGPRGQKLFNDVVDITVQLGRPAPGGHDSLVGVLVATAFEVFRGGGRTVGTKGGRRQLAVVDQQGRVLERVELPTDDR